MLINYRKRFIFVHVQKTAGTSMERLLLQRFPDTVQWLGRHVHASAGVEALGADLWRDYFSFGFVRNPWERLVSWYAMIDGQRRRLPWHKRWRRAPFDLGIWNQVARKARRFEDFVARCTEICHDQGYPMSFAFNQLDYLADRDGRLLVDFVGRYENLQKDSARIFARLGLDGATLPHENRWPHRPYSACYDAATRQLLAERFRRDIAVFGYRFEGAGA